ncbi:tetratricopeptide repeat protein, partial [Sinomonas humi]
MTEPMEMDPEDAAIISLCDLLQAATLGRADSAMTLARLDEIEESAAAGGTGQVSRLLCGFIRMRCSEEAGLEATTGLGAASSPETASAPAWARLTEAAVAPDMPTSLTAQSRMLSEVSDTLLSSGHLIPALHARSSAAALLESIGDVAGSAAVHSRLGETLMAAGAVGPAQKEFARAVMSFAGTKISAQADFLVRNLLNWGRCLSIQGEHEHAEPEYRGALLMMSNMGVLNSEAAEAHLLLADSLRQQGKTEEAVPEYKAALGLFSQYPPRSRGQQVAGLLGLSECHAATDHIAQSIMRMTEALALIGSEETAMLASVNLRLGLAHSKSGSTEQALGHFLTAGGQYADIGDAQAAAAAWRQSSVAFRRLDRIPEARDANLIAWQLLAESGPNGNPGLLMEVALAASRSLIEADRETQAEAPARAAIQAAQTAGAAVGEADAYISLGQALQAQNRHPEAIGCYKRALELGPSVRLIEVAGTSFLKLGRLAEAGRAFAQGAQHAEDNGDQDGAGGMHFRAGLALRFTDQQESERHLRAAAESAAALGNDNRAGLALTSLAETLKQLNRNVEAEDAYRQAHSAWERLGDAPKALMNLSKAGDAVRFQGRHGDAVAVYEEVLGRGAEAEWGTVADARFGMGVSLYHLGRYEEAEASFRLALAQYTGHESQANAAVALEWIADTFQ